MSPCDEVRLPDGSTAFLCSRGAAKPSPPRGQVWCPLRSKDCAWAGVASAVGEHLGAEHGRRYEVG